MVKALLPPLKSNIGLVFAATVKDLAVLLTYVKLTNGDPVRVKVLPSVVQGVTVVNTIFGPPVAGNLIVFVVPVLHVRLPKFITPPVISNVPPLIVRAPAPVVSPEESTIQVAPLVIVTVLGLTVVLFTLHVPAPVKVKAPLAAVLKLNNG
jgi:hypothetical protein